MGSLRDGRILMLRYLRRTTFNNGDFLACGDINLGRRFAALSTFLKVSDLPPVERGGREKEEKGKLGIVTLFFLCALS